MTLKEIKAKATVSELLLIEQVEFLMGDALTEKDRFSGEIAGWKSVASKLNEIESMNRDTDRGPIRLGALRAWVDQEIDLLSQKLQ